MCPSARDRFRRLPRIDADSSRSAVNVGGHISASRRPDVQSPLNQRRVASGKLTSAAQFSPIACNASRPNQKRWTGVGRRPR